VTAQREAMPGPRRAGWTAGFHGARWGCGLRPSCDDCNWFHVTVLGTEVLQSYGWGLFVALPFCLGLFSVWCIGYHVPRTYPAASRSRYAHRVAWAVLLLVMIEGVICILMAAPFALRSLTWRMLGTRSSGVLAA